MFACIHAPQAETIAARFSPEVETVAGGAVFSIDGLRLLYGGAVEIARAIADAAGRGARVAIANNATAAVLVARNFAGVTVLTGDDDVARALAPLTLDCLTLTPALQETLERWGIRTLGALARLPENGLAGRLGVEAVRLQRLARGESARPLHIETPDNIYEEHVELDHPVELLEPLLFVLAPMLGGLCARLGADGLAAQEVRLTLTLEDGSRHERMLRLPVPMRAPRPLLKLVQLDLEAHPPLAPMLAVTLAMQPAPPQRIQTGLFVPLGPEPGQLALTLARLRGLVGEENVGVPELLDTHRPGAFRLIAGALPESGARNVERPRCRLAFRYFRPARAVNVEMRNGQPVRMGGKIQVAAGPWRTSGGWWTSEAWERDEWDVALDDGGVYRIYRQPDGRWFIEGSYD